MDNALYPYEFQFSINERKELTAKMLKELRKDNNYSQKEVAALIQTKPTTYANYESGRSEPPLEYLVRLSYLYKKPIDFILQKDRLYKSAQDLKKVLKDYEKELEEIEHQIANGDVNNPILISMKETMEQLVNQLKPIVDELEN